MLEVQNQEGKNALTYALENSQTSAAQILRNHESKPSYGNRKNKIMELATKLMNEPPNYKKSIFKYMPTKIRLFKDNIDDNDDQKNKEKEK